LPDDTKKNLELANDYAKIYAHSARDGMIDPEGLSVELSTELLTFLLVT